MFEDIWLFGMCYAKLIVANRENAVNRITHKNHVIFVIFVNILKVFVKYVTKRFGMR